MAYWAWPAPFFSSILDRGNASFVKYLPLSYYVAWQALHKLVCGPNSRRPCADPPSRIITRDFRGFDAVSAAWMVSVKRAERVRLGPPSRCSRFAFLTRPKG
ncbi:hypothetical protein LX36DRAFT_313261 [Colletotrichum falcatum]|nr:hypothetical protein LX36DRAFT_313261 [Colletotrichum falcatum]